MNLFDNTWCYLNKWITQCPTNFYLHFYLQECVNNSIVYNLRDTDHS